MISGQQNFFLLLFKMQIHPKFIEVDAFFIETAEGVCLFICLSGRLRGGNPAYWMETLCLFSFTSLFLSGNLCFFMNTWVVKEKRGLGKRMYENTAAKTHASLAWCLPWRWRTPSIWSWRTWCDLRAYGDRCEDSCRRRASVVWLPLSGAGASAWVGSDFSAHWHVVTRGTGGLDHPWLRLGLHH